MKRKSFYFSFFIFHFSFLFVAVGLMLVSCWDANEELEATPSREFMRTSDVVVPGNGTQGTVHVDANCGWTISTTAPWLSLSASSGEGNGDVTATMTANPSSLEERSAVITLRSAEGITTTLTVRQEKNEEMIVVTPSELEFYADETGYQEFTVTANSSWSVTGAPAWVTLSTTEGTGTGSVRVTVSENTSEDSRTPAVLTVTGSGGTSATVSVRQSGRSALLTASPLNITATALRDAYTFTVTGNVNWQVGVSDDWLTGLSSDNGTGRQEITFFCRDNTVLTPRTGTITVMSENQRQKVEITVTQQAAELPVVGLLVMVELDEEQATLSSRVTSMFPVTEYGICYGETANPTTTGLKVVVGRETPVDETFSATLGGLTKGTTYHARAYAVSAVGTAYSDDLEFVALSRPDNGDNDRPQFVTRRKN
jgi:hypothetical protein